MIGSVTIPVDVETIDATLPAKLMNSWHLAPGISRGIPGGLIMFQAAFLNTIVGEPSLYRFIFQFGARQGAGVVGTWLFSQLYGSAAAIQIGGRAVPISHHAIVSSLKYA
jgi:hypothetical protein